MTSDAKIGLLLGLVFIFVIAFIINGLPNFGDHSKAGATPIMNIQNENFGIADNARNARERLDWEDLITREGEDLATVPDTAVAAETTAAQTDSTAVGDPGGVRRVYTLDTLDDLVGNMSGKIQEVVKNLIEPVPAHETTTEPAPAIESPKPESAQAKPVEAVVAQPTPATTTGTPTQKPTAGAAVKIYVVEDGDILSTVAKKAYGPEEGNRLVNIQRIFEANRTTLKTPDEIFIGQRLVIPPLPPAKPEAAKPDAGKTGDAKLSEALFEKVEQIGKRNVAEVKEASSKPDGRLYVVQDGDSLWKIAGSQLGSGARWEEIVKLNAETLKTKDATLVIGMKLKLPAK